MEIGVALVLFLVVLLIGGGVEAWAKWRRWE